ncbi:MULTISPECIES: flagellar biosynthetic protein FliR [Paenibacillus]|uniref:flagellar biosynthetic protein FliR n=1 Tax=Paenibacillus TaxID=44249 RepID=UPI0002EB8BA1|nr:MULTISPECIES: flagellar biosynthetic protein FliR [Paenibacillus]MBD8838015.1 flagellar type III secretion system protein FliR [Paenibacillus sp. CFBP 13594]MBT2283170.1 flagellar type III secretion system protein FliR [Paenibacillus polymyxa]WJM10426.1 flagellar biosynthetic protein FliR [Paenibacillus sp. PK1-4R]SDC79979.1 flagellar biosynthetic protein FliR [Paenibacillus sp. CF095]
METLLQSFPVALLMFCRITSFFVTAPVFSARNVPTSVKIGISAFVTLSVYLIYGIDQTVPTDLSYVLLIIREILIGLLLGFVAYLLMTAVQTAGTFIDLQIGFGMANVYDPMTGASAPLTGNLKYAFAMLLFLTMNGHHYLLDAIVYSYRWVPLSNVFFLRLADGSIAEFLIQTLGQSFMLAFQMSAPIVVALFLTDVGLGFLAKTAPQFNVFAVGLPLKLLVGLAILLLLVPSFSFVFSQLFEAIFRSMEKLLGTIGQRPG